MAVGDGRDRGSAARRAQLAEARRRIVACGRLDRRGVLVHRFDLIRQSRHHPRASVERYVAGIRLSDVPGFIGAQLGGAFLGWYLDGCSTITAAQVAPTCEKPRRRLGSVMPCRYADRLAAPAIALTSWWASVLLCMIAYRRKPHRALAGFVEDFWLYDEQLSAHARERILPSGTFGAVFLQFSATNELRIYGLRLVLGGVAAIPVP